jgi:hypothetical protein
MKMTFDTHTNRRDRTRRAPAGLPIPTHFDIQTNYRKSTVSIQFELRIDLEGVRDVYDLPDVPKAHEAARNALTEYAKSAAADWLETMRVRGEIIEPNQ